MGYVKVHTCSLLQPSQATALHASHNSFSASTNLWNDLAKAMKASDGKKTVSGKYKLVERPGESHEGVGRKKNVWVRRKILALLAFTRLLSGFRSSSVFAACFGLFVAFLSFLCLRFSLPPLVVHCGCLVQSLPLVPSSRLLLLCDRPGCLTLCQVSMGTMCPCFPPSHGTKGFGPVWGIALSTMLRVLFLAHGFPAHWDSLLRSGNPLLDTVRASPVFLPAGCCWLSLCPVLPSPALPPLFWIV